MRLKCVCVRVQFSDVSFHLDLQNVVFSEVDLVSPMTVIFTFSQLALVIDKLLHVGSYVMNRQFVYCNSTS